MGNGSVQQVRSEREFQYGRADRLATGAPASEARRLVAVMTEIDLRLMSVGRAVVRAPAWILKTGRRFRSDGLWRYREGERVGGIAR